MKRTRITRYQIQTNSYNVVVILSDVRGTQHRFEEPPRRVISLVPSLTETLFDLGAGDSVVAVTDYCIFPTALDRPRVGGTKNPDLLRIRELRPDLVHMNREENLSRHGDLIEAFAPLFVTEPRSVSDVAALIGMLGTIHGRSERAAELNDELRVTRGVSTNRGFTFACAIWKGPWMWCGGDTYVSDLIACVGGTNVLQSKTRYPTIALPEVLSLAPDFILLPDEPYLFTAEDAAGISRARVIGPFPGHFVTWHGTRTARGLRFLREAVESA